MHEQKQIDEPVVGVWLGRAREGGRGEIVGEEHIVPVAYEVPEC